MKIAYLITAYNNYEHLKRLIEVLNDGHSTFFIHIDKKSPMPSNIEATENIRFIKRIKVWWGGWSHQQAILDLMKEASKEKFNYYVLLSGADYPIRPASFLYNKLVEGGEYISLMKGFHEMEKPESRVRFYYFDCFDRRNHGSLKTKFFLLMEKYMSKIYVRRKYPFKEIYHGSAWWTLSHNCVSYVLEFLNEHPSYIQFFKHTFCPEECVFHTIIGNSVFLKECKGSLTYTEWLPLASSPSTISNEHVEKFKLQEEFELTEGKYQPFFARKFDPAKTNILYRVDRELRMPR